MVYSARDKFIKIGAYLVLTLGSILSLAMFIVGLGLIFFYPEVSINKKAVISGLIIGFSVILFLIAFAFFEALIELTVIGEKLGEEERKVEQIGR